MFDPPFTLISMSTPKGCTVEDIKAVFRPYGTLHGDGVTVSTTRKDPRFSVTFATVGGAIKAYTALNGTRCPDLDPTLRLSLQYSRDTRLKLTAMGLLDELATKWVAPKRMPPGPVQRKPKGTGQEASSVYQLLKPRKRSASPVNVSGSSNGIKSSRSSQSVSHYSLADRALQKLYEQRSSKKPETERQASSMGLPASCTRQAASSPRTFLSCKSTSSVGQQLGSLDISEDSDTSSSTLSSSSPSLGIKKAPTTFDESHSGTLSDSEGSKARAPADLREKFQHLLTSCSSAGLPLPPPPPSQAILLDDSNNSNCCNDGDPSDSLGDSPRLLRSCVQPNGSLNRPIARGETLPNDQQRYPAFASRTSSLMTEPLTEASRQRTADRFLDRISSSAPVGADEDPKVSAELLRMNDCLELITSQQHGVSALPSMSDGRHQRDIQEGASFTCLSSAGSSDVPQSSAGNLTTVVTDDDGFSPDMIRKDPKSGLSEEDAKDQEPHNELKYIRVRKKRLKATGHVSGRLQPRSGIRSSEASSSVALRGDTSGTTNEGISSSIRSLLGDDSSLSGSDTRMNHEIHLSVVPVPPLMTQEWVMEARELVSVDSGLFHIDASPNYQLTIEPAVAQDCLIGHLAGPICRVPLLIPVPPSILTTRQHTS